jgi:hypothetical protein
MCALGKVDVLSFWKKYRPKAPVVDKISVATFLESFRGLIGQSPPPIRLWTDHLAQVTEPPPSHTLNTDITLAELLQVLKKLWRNKAVDFWHFVVGSQTANLTLCFSFCHNLCCKCPNGSCKLILDIYTSIAFQWYRKLLNERCFDFCNRSLKFLESTETPNSQNGSSLGSVSLHLHTLSHSFWPAPLQAFALVTSLRLGLWQTEQGKKEDTLLLLCGLQKGIQYCAAWNAMAGVGWPWGGRMFLAMLARDVC